MPTMRALVALTAWLLVIGCASAGPINLPSDIAVGLTANRSEDLVPGQLITFTITVTNNGPEPVHPLSLIGSPIYDELDVFGGTADCENRLALAVADGDDFFYYIYSWFPIFLEDDPLPVGATRSCY